MSGLGSQRLVVGFRDDDPRRAGLGGGIMGGRELGRCVDCGHAVYGDLGCVDLVRKRDAQVGCMFCHESLVYRERLHQQGMVVQL